MKFKKILMLILPLILLFSITACPPINEESIPNEKYTVIYDSNGAESGIPPQDTNEYYKGDIAIIKGNEGNLAKSGYEFAGWSSGTDGNGELYVESDGIVITSDLTLYASWCNGST